MTSQKNHLPQQNPFFPQQVIKVSPEAAARLTTDEILQMIADEKNRRDDDYTHTVANERLVRVCEEADEDGNPVEWEEWAVIEVSPNPNPAGYTVVTLEMTDEYVADDETND